MKKLSLAAIAVISLIGTSGVVSAAEIKGKICNIDEARFSNDGTSLVDKLLWEYKEKKLPVEPAMGYIDIACADRGGPRSPIQDFGKRIWFSLSGEAGEALEHGKLLVSDPVINSTQADAGISIRGLAIYAVITPRHDCVYSVNVWAESCKAH